MVRVTNYPIVSDVWKTVDVSKGKESNPIPAGAIDWLWVVEEGSSSQPAWFIATA